MLPHSEVNYEDMMKILKKVHVYVPSKYVQKEITFTDEKGSECAIKIDDKNLITTPVGGD